MFLLRMKWNEKLVLRRSYFKVISMDHANKSLKWLLKITPDSMLTVNVPNQSFCVVEQVQWCVISPSNADHESVSRVNSKYIRTISQRNLVTIFGKFLVDQFCIP